MEDESTDRMATVNVYLDGHRPYKCLRRSDFNVSQGQPLDERPSKHRCLAIMVWYSANGDTL
jgi:hypothetical protein